MKKYIVRLTDEERELLAQIDRCGKTQAFRIQHARILLQVDANGAACVVGVADVPAAAAQQAIRAHSRTPRITAR